MRRNRIVALDIGDKRIGIAVSDDLWLTAQPLETYTRIGYGPDVRHITEICDKYQTKDILSGLPKNMDGSEGFQTEKVRNFTEQLERAGLNVFFYDERMTTVLAEGALIEGNVRREDRKKKVDMVAAVMILQSYLDAQRQNAADDPFEDDEADEEDDIFEMEDEDGTVIRFRLIARIEYAGHSYIMLNAEDDAGDLMQGESVIMQEVADESGEVCYQSLEDEKLIAEVYDAYLAQTDER